MLAVLFAPLSVLAEPPPASAFDAPDGINIIQISPNGQRLAIASREGDQAVIKFATVDQPKVTLARLGDVAILGIRWLGNDRVIVDTNFPTKIYDRYRTVGRVAVVGADDGRALMMLLDDKTSNNLIRHQVVGATPGSFTHFYMVGAVTQGRLAYRALLNVDAATGRGDVVEVGTAKTSSWVLDKAGTVRGRMLTLEKGDFAIEARTSPDAPWKQVWRSDGAEDQRGYHGYSAPDDAIMVIEHGPDGDQLVFKHLADGSGTPMGKPHNIDPTTYVWDTKGRTLAGRGFGAERPEMEWLQPDLGPVQASLQKVFKSAEVYLSDWSTDRTRFVVAVSAPDLPTSWYLYDRSRKELSPLGDSHPGLKGVPLGATRWITYTARDGLELSAYVTLPPGAKPGERVPLVLLPHDELRSRDNFGFNSMVQFLATRGYAVLRPQYRGSSGFGRAFEKAADWEWGGKVETDLLDGVTALATEGLIDPKRVCIVGENFAGYLALAGASLHPQAFACAISTSGASDLTGVVTGWGGAPFAPVREVLEKTDARDPRYAAMSPRVHAAAVECPILLMWKEQDAVTPSEQSEAMVWALKSAHKQVETVVLTGTDHDERTGKGETQLFEALETFLAKNLPVHQS